MSAPDAGSLPRLKLFVSYAHDDDVEEKALSKHLRSIGADRAGYYEIWDDRQIGPGQEWNPEIQQQLAEAHVVLMLLSSAFINSDYIWQHELPQALEQRRKGQTDIVPVILKPCNWDDPAFEFNRFQGILNERKPISLGNWDAGFDAVVQDLKKVYTRRTSPPKAAQTLFAPATPAGQIEHTAPPRPPEPPPPPPPPPPWKRYAVALAVLVLAIGVGAYFHITHEAEAAAEAGWRFARIGDYAGAAAQFAQAGRHDGHGAEAAALGDQLATLGEHNRRAPFVARLDAFEKAAPAASTAGAFAAYLRAAEKFDRGLYSGDAEAIYAAFRDARADLQRATAVDPQLAEAYALDALLLSFECRLDEALAAIDGALKAGGSQAPQRYQVNKANILARSADPERRRQALAIYAAQPNEAEATFALALQALDDRRWADAHSALAAARQRVAEHRDSGAWLPVTPQGYQLFARPPDKQCLFAYADAAADSLERGGDSAAAWQAVKDCTGLERAAREVLCPHLPAGAVPQCPPPQPLAFCPAPPPAARPSQPTT